MKKMINLITSNILFRSKNKISRLKDPNSFLNNVSGIIHVGANSGQERGEYSLYSLDVLWVEPIPEVFKKLKKILKNIPNKKVMNIY